MEECFIYIRKNGVGYQTMINSLERGEKPRVTSFGMFWDEDYDTPVSKKALDAKNKLQEKILQVKYRTGGEKYLKGKEDFLSNAE